MLLLSPKRPKERLTVESLAEFPLGTDCWSIARAEASWDWALSKERFIAVILNNAKVSSEG